MSDTDTPRTDAILCKIPGGQTCDPQQVADEIRGDIEQMERELSQARETLAAFYAGTLKLDRELDALRKTADKLEHDKEYNADLITTLRCELEDERALADRLAETLANVQGDYATTGAITSSEVEQALAAWKEARKP